MRKSVIACLFLGLYIGFMVFVLVHESGHYIAIWALGGTPEIICEPIGTWDVMVAIRDTSYIIYSNPVAYAIVAFAGTGATFIVGYVLAYFTRTGLSRHSRVWGTMIGFTLPYTVLPVLDHLFVWISGECGDCYILNMLGIPYWLSFIVTFMLGIVLMHQLVEVRLLTNGATYELDWRE